MRYRSSFLLAAVVGGVVVVGVLALDGGPQAGTVLDCSDQFTCNPVRLNATIEPLSCRWDVAGFGNFVGDVSMSESEREQCGGQGYVAESCPYSLYSLSKMLGCEMTGADTDEVTFVADPANYITTPRTSAGYRTTVVSSGELTNPWDISFLPDGTPLITEKDGDIKILSANGPRTIAQIPEVDTDADVGTGLHGLAIEPSFDQNPFIYVLYTYDSGEDMAWNRISRFRLERSEASATGWALSDERVLVNSIRGSPWHNGGRLRFGPDGKLYVTTGDADIFRQNENRPQMQDALEGKVLRLNRNGTVPADNPVPGNPMYTMGHRNPQGIAWHPITGDLYITEHGPIRHDEVNRASAGGENFGWGLYKCDSALARDSVPPPVSGPINYTAPLHCFSDYTMAPSGAVFVDDPSHPWYGDLFVAGLRGKHVHRFINGTGGNDVFFIPEGRSIPNRLRDVAFHNGSLWIIGKFTGVARLTPGGSAS